MEVVSPAKQTIFMHRVLFGFAIRRKQVRHVSTARLTLEQWEGLVETSCLLHQVLEEMEKAALDDGTKIFPPDAVAKAQRRAIEGILG